MKPINRPTYSLLGGMLIASWVFVFPLISVASITPVSRNRLVTVENPNMSTGGFVEFRDDGDGAGPIFNQTAQLVNAPGSPFLSTLASQRSQITSNFISATGRLFVQGSTSSPSGYSVDSAMLVYFDVLVNTPYTLELRTSSTPGTVTDFVSELVLGRDSPSQIGYVSYGLNPNSNLSNSGVLLPGRHRLSFDFFFIDQPPSSPIPDSRGDLTYSVTLLVPAPTSAVSLAALGVLALRRRR